MTTLEPTASTPQFAPGSATLRLAPALFAVALFLSALLLFLVQPMFTKMVLPRLGGAPTVWSVAMVFFQAALLAGYAYAHLLVRQLPLGRGALVHLGVLAAAQLTLPIGIADAFGTPPTSGIALWLIGLFAVSIGLSFAALSASAPLLQGWFAASGHPPVRPLRRVQSRIVRGADRLSDRDRADASAQGADAALVGGVCRPCHSHRGGQPVRGAPAGHRRNGYHGQARVDA
jgi:hypothetical protein